MAFAVTVLVVDDDSDSRDLLGITLSEAGYAVLFASNEAEALAIARRHQPDVILLDLAMPVMDGFAFRAAQRWDAELARIPVICVSGRHDAVQVARDLELAGCVSKPFSLDEIVMRVESLAGTSTSREPLLPPVGGAYV
jgi:DNA-binding response OmpR family regulator